MMTDTASGISMTSLNYPSVKRDPTSREEKSPVSAAADVLSKKSGAASVDTISISVPSQQATVDSKGEVAKREKERKASVEKNDTGARSDKSIANVEFVYDLRGELSVRYMDTSDRLIYQVPSELMQRMKEAAAHTDTSVDMKV